MKHRISQSEHDRIAGLLALAADHQRELRRARRVIVMMLQIGDESVERDILEETLALGTSDADDLLERLGVTVVPESN